MTDFNTPSFPINRDLDPRHHRPAFGSFPGGVASPANSPARRGDHAIVLLRLHADHWLPLVLHHSAFGLRNEQGRR